VSSDFSASGSTRAGIQRILRFANRFQPGLVRRVKLYTKETPLYDQFGLNEEINKALKSKVWLKSGGYIVINQTEALVAIDVNTGKYVGRRAPRRHHRENKRGCDQGDRPPGAAPRSGGIIIIDSIAWTSAEKPAEVMQALEEALRLDRAPSRCCSSTISG